MRERKLVTARDMPDEVGPTDTRKEPRIAQVAVNPALGFALSDRNLIRSRSSGRALYIGWTIFGASVIGTDENRKLLKGL